MTLILIGIVGLKRAAWKGFWPEWIGEFSFFGKIIPIWEGNLWVCQVFATDNQLFKKWYAN